MVPREGEILGSGFSVEILRQNLSPLKSSFPPPPPPFVAGSPAALPWEEVAAGVALGDVGPHELRLRLDLRLLARRQRVRPCDGGGRGVDGGRVVGGTPPPSLPPAQQP